MTISDDIIGVVKGLRKDGKSYRYIADITNISHRSVGNILADNRSKNKRKTGPKNKVSRAQVISMKREQAKLRKQSVKVTANKIRNACNLDHVCVRTIRRELAKFDCNYTKATVEITLTREQKQRRLASAKIWLSENMNFEIVVWTDEKRFNLDGPDSWCSWIRKGDKLHRDKRQQGGKSIQFWGMFLPDGRIILQELHQRSKSSDYIRLLETFVMPTLDEELGDNYIFMHDNASIHDSKETRAWLASNNVKILKWPSRSPDLNPIENIWKMLSDIVYDGPQFKNVSELREAVQKAVDYLNQNKREQVMNIRNSMRARLVKVCDQKGDKIDY